LAVEDEPRPFEGAAAHCGKNDDDDDDDDDSSAISKFGSALFPNTGAAANVGDADADLTQVDLNAMTGNMSLTGVTDPVTLAFYHRMNMGGDENDVRGQCLRYNRWPDVKEGEGVEEGCDYDDVGDDVGDGPLWLSSNDRPPVSSPDDAPFPPPCEYCGARREFEFQILPQMLSCLTPTPPLDADDVPSVSNRSKTTTTSESDLAILMEAHSMIESGMDLPAGFRESHEEAVANARRRLLSGAGEIDGPERSSLGVDWGVIAVYTCTASCGDGGIVCEENGCYREEVAWLQPPLD
jgi:pre-rRNA-processing protein TSR4